MTLLYVNDDDESRAGSDTTLRDAPLAAFDWLKPAAEMHVPALILHGVEDTSAPVTVSRLLAQRLPDIVRVETFDSDHTLTWNADPALWRASAFAWVSSYANG